MRIIFSSIISIFLVCCFACNQEIGRKRQQLASLQASLESDKKQLKFNVDNEVGYKSINDTGYRMCLKEKEKTAKQCQDEKNKSDDYIYKEREDTKKRITKSETEIKEIEQELKELIEKDKQK